MSASVPLHLPTKSGIRAGGGSNPVTVVRVLYVHSMIDEKSSSTMLEEVTHKIVQSPLLVFTCVTTSFMAIECVQSTSFDLVITEKNLPLLSGVELMNVLYRHNYFIPVIFLITREDTEKISFKFPSNVAVETLADPYTPLELCSTIYRILHSKKIYLRFLRHVPPPSSVVTAPYPPMTVATHSSAPRIPPPEPLLEKPSSHQMKIIPTQDDDIRPSKRGRESVLPQPSIECLPNDNNTLSTHASTYQFSQSDEKESFKSILSTEEEELLWEDLLNI